jgi:hypothetical protein
MRRGLELEPVARAKYEAETGIPMPAVCLTHPDIEYMRASFDGLNYEARGAAEFKCPGAEDHIEALNGNVPKKYISQCIHNLFVAGFEWIDYFSFNPDFDGPSTARIRVIRDNRLERELLADEKNFRRFIETRTPPPPGPKELPWPWPKYVLNQGETMKNMNPSDRPALTAREIVEVAEKLKALGVAVFKMQGIEYDFSKSLINGTEIARGAPMTPPPRNPRPICDCGAEKIPSKRGRGFYCVECFIRDKESKQRH